MEYKHVPISDELTLAVPLGFSADEEARFIARHIAFVDLDKIAADMKNSLKMWEEGKMIPMEKFLEELKNDNDGEPIA